MWVEEVMRDRKPHLFDVKEDVEVQRVVFFARVIMRQNEQVPAVVGWPQVSQGRSVD